MSKSIQRSTSAVSAQDGRYIFAYCNIRTNQVLYSLQRQLKDAALRQLPDMGANNNPPSIRRDLWKPLWTLVYGKSSQGYSHGLRAFEELKELRILHDYNTPPPADNASWPSREVIEELQDNLDRRGGSKITTVGKLIAREKKKARARVIMDQKANSIADLAAVLMKQDVQYGNTTESHWVMTRRREIKNMVEQADRPMDFIRRLQPTLATIAGSMHSKASGPKVDGRLTNTALEAAQLKVIRAINSIKTSFEFVKRARAHLHAARQAAKRNEDAAKAVPGTVENVESSLATESDQDAAEAVSATTGDGEPSLATESNQDAAEAVSATTGDGKLSLASESDQGAAKAIGRRGKRMKKQKTIFDPLALQPSDEVQGTLTPATAVALRLNTRLPRPDLAAEEVTTDPAAMQWQKVENSIMSAKTLDELQIALLAIKRRGRGAEICEAVAALQSSEVMASVRDASASTSAFRETNALDLAPYIPSPALINIPAKDLPKDALERVHVKRSDVSPNFARGARVQWKDVLDAEFAQAWPEDVRHTPMGITGHEAPDPHAPVLMDTIDYSERVACESEYKLLLKSEALEAEGKLVQAEKLREGIKMVRKNEHGDHELINIKERFGAQQTLDTQAASAEDQPVLQGEQMNA
ncbi:hypothetical protein AMS68_000490 [Peltaster fructicola]|uniref:Large ribosomal subunit protein mL67 n=1 Tax=Peltaster fructicola TaxID=286661 RepID=A0A6H0XJR2_9PEZI|nr:hypothetical protein AMS68_000490 [Peltaster fructicola]